MEGGRRFDYPGMNKVDELLTPILFIRFRNPGLELSTCTEPDWRQTTPQCVSHCPISQPVRFASGASSFQTVEASEIKAISGAVSSCVCLRLQTFLRVPATSICMPCKSLMEGTGKGRFSESLDRASWSSARQAGQGLGFNPDK